MYITPLPTENFIYSEFPSESTNMTCSSFFPCDLESFHSIHSYPTCWAWRHTVALCWRCRKSSPFHPNTPQRLLAATRLRDPAMHWHSQQRSRGISISPGHAWYVVSHDLLRHFVRIEFEPEQFFNFEQNVHHNGRCVLKLSSCCCWQAYLTSCVFYVESLVIGPRVR